MEILKVISSMDTHSVSKENSFSVYHNSLINFRDKVKNGETAKICLVDCYTFNPHIPNILISKNYCCAPEKYIPGFNFFIYFFFTNFFIFYFFIFYFYFLLFFNFTIIYFFLKRIYF